MQFIYLFFFFLFTISVFQATAEQIRLAQMIYDKNDADFEDKVNQVRSVYRSSGQMSDSSYVTFEI